MLEASVPPIHHSHSISFLALDLMRKLIGRKIRRILIAVRRKFSKASPSWQAATHDEAHFWKLALSNPAAHWNVESYQFRLDPAAPLQAELRALLPSDAAVVRVLDVGAGPLTTLGKIWEGHRVEIIATDPLASTYDTILKELGLTPPVRTVCAKAESLLETFSPQSFDLAYSSNALDHAEDPIRAILQMLQCVRIGGWVYLWHFENEGETEAYQGMHQWNFESRNGDFTISDGRKRYSLREACGRSGELQVQNDHAFGKRVVIAMIRRLE
jgi:SAM-dependent methyltransferase